MPVESAFHLRLATRDDLPRLRELVRASVLGLSQKVYSDLEMEGAIGHALGIDAQLIDDRTYFIAAPVHDPLSIAGSGGWSYRRTLCGGDLLPDRELSPLDPIHDAARIRAIYVHPDFARRGLGAFILKQCEEAASVAGFRRFEMGSTLTGVPLYTLKGYQERSRFTIPLPNGAHLGVVHMVKSL